MIVVVDSNVIFSALIRDSISRKLIFKLEYDLVTSNLFFEEFNKYRKELISKSRLSEKEFDEALGLILKYIKIVSNEELKPYRDEAWKLVGEHSPEDVMFVSCALKFKDSILWSDDKKLKWQDKVKVLSTEEIIVMFVE